MAGTRVTLFNADLRRGMQVFSCPTCGGTTQRDGSLGARNPAMACSLRCFLKWRSYQGARESAFTGGRAGRAFLHGIQLPGPIE
jgi:hypothetical protein